MIQMHFGFSNLLQRFLHIVWYCSPSQGASFLGWFFSGTCTQSIFTLLSSVAVWLHPPLCGKSKELSPALCVKAWSTSARDVQTSSMWREWERKRNSVWHWGGERRWRGGGEGEAASDGCRAASKCQCPKIVASNNQTEDTKQTTALRSSKHRLTQETRQTVKPPSVFRSR